MSRTQNVWSSRSLHSGKTQFVHLSEATTLDYEGSGLFSATQTDHTYSFANNVPSGLTTVTGTSASASRRAGNQWLLGTRLSRTSQAYTFQRDATNWLNGFVTGLTTTQGTGSNRKSQTLTRTPYLKGSKKTMSVGTATQSRGSAGSLTTTNVYDQWGNPTSVTTQKVGDATTSRTTRYASYANRRYPGSVTNAEGEASAFTYDLRFGTPKTIRSPDGRSSAITRDGLGRVVKVEDTTSGNDRLTTVNFFEATGSVYGHDRKYMARVTDSGGPDRITYFDKLGRQVSGAVQGYNTYQWNVQDTGYDRLGRVVSESVPYQRIGLPGGHSQHAVRSTTEYDSRHRVISQRAADGGRSDYSYGMSGSNLRVGKTKKVYSGTTLQSTATSYQYWNGLGQRVKTTDALGTHTTFAYDTMGNLTSSRVGSNPATTMTYDAIGQRTQIAEPHTGTTRFKWTAFGELKEQTNGAGRIVRYEYDHTGRLTRRLDDAQTGKPTTENEWTYGTSGTGKGKLTSMTQDKGNDGSNEFTETYAYDLKSGRSSSVTTTIRHSGIATQTIYSTRGYDSQGRQSSAWNDGYGTAYAYSAYGYRTHVNNTNVSPPSTLEQTRSMDAFGNPTEVKYNFNGAVTIQSFDEASGRTRSVRTDVHFANGTRTVQDLSYKWRTDGALKSRTDHLPATDLKETFTHDNLRRLTRASSRHASGTRNLDYRYDTLGNLTSKTSNVNADADVTGYTYSSTKPNALTSVRVGTENLTLTHDTVGNVTAINSNSGEDKAFTYNALNLATSITMTDSGGRKVASETFEYGPDNQRYLRKTEHVRGNQTYTTYTVYAQGGRIERIIASNGYTTKKIRVTGKVTVRTTPSRYPNWSRVYHYALHRDHLGSVYTTTDDNGTAGTAITHDPFGGGRRSDWSRGSTQSERVASLESLAYRYVRTGLTGHEALERTGIMHMNGRLYDPVIGRFLNADPYVQSPGFSQSHNRYSYVMNSPTGFTDPSGYQCQRGQDGECGDPTPNPIRPLPRWRPSPGPSLAQIWQAYQNMLRREDTARSQIMGNQVAANGVRASGFAPSFDDSELLDQAKVIGALVVQVLPGADLANCAINGGCSNAEWGVAAGIATGEVVFIVTGGPVVVAASVLHKVYRAHKVYKATKLANMRKIQFGGSVSKKHHAFRHVDDLGLDRKTVQSAIEKHVNSPSFKMPPSGKSANHTIRVSGHQLQYTAYKLKDGTLNIGRIHSVSP